jgi:hypothetical protein
MKPIVPVATVMANIMGCCQAVAQQHGQPAAASVLWGDACAACYNYIEQQSAR